MRRERRKPLTKPGKHGTLTRYLVTYEVDRGVEFTWATWAYDREHAEDRWHESAALQGFDDCPITKIETVYQH